MSIYKKLHTVKKGLKYLQKDTTGHNYKYVSGSAVLGAVNPLLEENQLILKTEVLKMNTERIEVKTKYDTKIETLFTLEMKMTFVDVETGEQDVNLWTSAGCNGDEKGYGSALTYAERYFFLKYFNIANDEDSPEERELKNMTQEQKEEKERKNYENSLIASINKCSTSIELEKYKKSIPSDWIKVKNVINAYNKKLDSFPKVKQESKKEQSTVMQSDLVKAKQIQLTDEIKQEYLSIYSNLNDEWKKWFDKEIKQLEFNEYSKVENIELKVKFIREQIDKVK